MCHRLGHLEPRTAQVKKGDVFVQWDPYNVPILTEKTARWSSAT
jgi:hypothetical protein